MFKVLGTHKVRLIREKQCCGQNILYKKSLVTHDVISSIPAMHFMFILVFYDRR